MTPRCTGGPAHPSAPAEAAGPIRLLVMMLRPPVALVLLMSAALGMAPSGRAEGLHPLFTTVAVIVSCWFIHATVLNDLGDEAIDRVNLVNARGRPLVSGATTRARLLALGCGTGLVALVVAWAVNWRVGIVVTVGLGLNAAYSLRPVRLSDRGVVASLLLPLGYVALPFLVGVFSVEPDLHRVDVILLVGLYVTFIGRIVLKDFRDIRGDERFGKRTFLVRYGRTATCVFSAACWVAGSATLLALVPLRSLLVGAFVAYLACVVDGLRRLHAARGPVEEQVVIGAVAQVGRGMAVALLAHFAMVHQQWSPGAQGAVMLALAFTFAGMYVAILGERHTVSSIRPY